MIAVLGQNVPKEGYTTFYVDGADMYSEKCLPWESCLKREEEG